MAAEVGPTMRRSASGRWRHGSRPQRTARRATNYGGEKRIWGEEAIGEAEERPANAGEVEEEAAGAGGRGGSRRSVALVDAEVRKDAVVWMDAVNGPGTCALPRYDPATCETGPSTVLRQAHVNALLRDSCIDRKVLKVVVPLPKVGMLPRRTVAACSGVTDENVGVVGGVSSPDSTEV
ncbi:hypothetical protein TRIUR3_20691 [Triticum urartu]|uniref:Uncharacterized protein n=1 Tax=Triticum urartu TaxID=4572 RepID=M7ZBP0_TRIUA|nr:hypothetical protein TRIUR3_20691 [Triticum urartu]